VTDGVGHRVEEGRWKEPELISVLCPDHPQTLNLGMIDPIPIGIEKNPKGDLRAQRNAALRNQVVTQNQLEGIHPKELETVTGITVRREEKNRRNRRKDLRLLLLKTQKKGRKPTNEVIQSPLRRKV